MPLGPREVVLSLATASVVTGERKEAALRAEQQFLDERRLLDNLLTLPAEKGKLRDRGEFEL